MPANSKTADIIIAGAGIVGASIAARLAGRAKVIVLEMEDQPGYHATGRSAASWQPTYGPPVIRALTAASGPFFASPPEGFAQVALVAPRGIVSLGEADDEALIAATLAAGFRRASFAEALARHPLLRQDFVAFVFINDIGTDVDVEALHRGFLRQHKLSGGELIVKARVESGLHHGGAWHLETAAGNFSAPILVNAAGAWADRLAGACGVRQLGLVPKRRSACIIAPPAGTDPRAWPHVDNLKETFYAKPMGGKLMLSPADAVPSEPHDAFADDLALAEAIDVYQRFVSHEVTRIERSWGGLRTFAADGDPVTGFDPAAAGFFWSAGQGGYGIQTAPALSAIAAALILGDDVPAGIAAHGVTAAALSPARFDS